MQIQIVCLKYVGKSCKKSTQDFLLNVESIDNKARKSFMQKCAESLNRLEERIKKGKIHNFTTESAKRKIRGAEGKIIEATLIREFLGSILLVNATKGTYGGRFKIPTYACSALLKSCRWFS